MVALKVTTCDFYNNKKACTLTYTYVDTVNKYVRTILALCCIVTYIGNEQSANQLLTINLFNVFLLFFLPFNSFFLIM